MTDNTDYSKYLANVPPQNNFVLSNGRIIENLDSLYYILRDSDDSIFYHHVTNERNDFANWIKYCIFYDALYDKLVNMRQKSDFLDVLSKELSFLRNPPIVSAPLDAPVAPQVQNIVSPVTVQSFSNQSTPIQSTPEILNSVQSVPIQTNIVQPAQIQPTIVQSVDAQSSQVRSLQNNNQNDNVTSTNISSSNIVSSSNIIAETVFEFESIFKNILDDLEKEILSWDN